MKMLTARQIAKITGMDRTAVAHRAQRQHWPYIEVRGKGKGGMTRLYLVDGLPVDRQRAIRRAENINNENSARRGLPESGREDIGCIQGSSPQSGRDGVGCVPGGVQSAMGCVQTVSAHSAKAETSGLPAVIKSGVPAVTDGTNALAPLTDSQRQTRDARSALLAYIDRELLIGKGWTKRRALAYVNQAARAGRLPAHLQALVPRANARWSSKRGVSPGTLRKWYRGRVKGALVPRVPQKRAEKPAWAAYFLDFYQRPQKPSIPQALEAMARAYPDAPVPSVGQCRRLLYRMGAVSREKGRRTGGALQKVKTHTRRDTEGYEPLEVVTCDGHTFKAKVAHPDHGRPFQPEVCAVLDLGTRRVTGWSVGVAESAETVAFALECTIKNEGVPDIFYTDRGSGNKAKVNSDSANGRYDRIGVTFKTGRPGRPWSRGAIEILQKTLWIRAAKWLPSYCGRDMDKGALRKISLKIEKDIREKGVSPLLISWVDFLAFCQQAIDDYNNRPHSQLPKITDESGRRRHMTPNEAWQVWVRNGWEPMRVSEQDLEDAWRPRVPRVTLKGEVKILSSTYFSKALEEYHGRDVLVEYEQQDGEYVWVRDLEGRLLAKAKFQGNRHSYFPVTARQAAKDKRADARRKRKERQIEDIEAERRGSGVFDVTPEPRIQRMIEEGAAKLEAAEAEKKAAAEAEKIPTDMFKRWDKWKELDEKIKAGGEIPEHFLMFYKAYPDSSEWKISAETEEMKRRLYAGAEETSQEQTVKAAFG